MRIYKQRGVRGMELATLTVQRKKDGLGGIIGRAISLMVGGTLTLIGALVFITIIGILPGLGLMMIGILMLGAAIKNSQTVVCPECKKKANVQKDSEEYKCLRCEKVIILNWQR
ncbi:hypothetical protein [Psychrobacillus sp. FSL K6-1415]|uniref:hypothetical protein n=1 Tax=Psychrobacillus sp. FSL K6-1415 TaxID=2921544 RepID=UPI0030F79A08